MELLTFMREQAEELRGVDDVDIFNEIVDKTEKIIRKGLNINDKNEIMILPDDIEDVIDWLDGESIYVLRNIDYYEGGIFYYYLCRIGMC